MVAIPQNKKVHTKRADFIDENFGRYSATTSKSISADWPLPKSTVAL